MKKEINYHGDVIVFDLDDTLIYERDYCREGFRRIEGILTNPQSLAALHNGEAKCLRKAAESFFGIADELSVKLQNREKYFDYLDYRLQEWHLEECLTPLIEAYRNNPEAEIKLKPGMHELLEHLSSRGIIMGIITDGRSASQRYKIKAAGLERYFDPDNIMISEETGKDKTNPANFRHFVSRYPEARRFHYIGDNERKDFLIPNLMGWATHKMKWDFDNVHEDFINSDKMSRPSSVLSNPSDFLNEI